MIDEKNFKTVNQIENCEEIKWGLPAMLMKSKQFKIRLNSGKTYDYISSANIKVGDIAVIGNMCDDNDTRCKSTGEIGIVEEVIAKPTVNGIHTARLEFSLKRKVAAKDVNYCERIIQNVFSESRAFGDVWIVSPISDIIRNILASSTILAFPELASDEGIENAKETILGSYSPDCCMFKYEYGPGLSNMYFDDLQIVVDESEFKVIEKGCRKHRLDIGDNYIVREDLFNCSAKKTHDINESFNEFFNKYGRIGAIAVMARCGAVNLLKAYLSTGVDITPYKQILSDGLSDCVSESVMELLK